MADIQLFRISSSFLEQTHYVSSPHCGVRMSCFLLRWYRHSPPLHPSCSHCLFTIRDDAMGSPPLSRRSEEGFDRRQEHIQFKWFPEGDELALLKLLLRERSTGCHHDGGGRGWRMIEMQA